MPNQSEQNQIVSSPKRSRLNFQAKVRHWLLYSIGARLLHQYETLIPQYSKIANTPFLESQEFEWTQELEGNWQLIRQELNEILKYTEQLPNFQDISPDQAYNLSRDSLWKTFFLYGYGIKMTENCQRCPQTTRIIEKIPGMKTAFFSILLPGKHIPEHRGPYKGVIRCLLGLKIPEPKEHCCIRVANEIRHWEEGKATIFDDSYPHEAWNKTDDIRVVLFLDIVRPMRFPLSWVNAFLLKIIAASPFVQDAYVNQKQWEQRLEKLFSK